MAVLIFVSAAGKVPAVERMIDDRAMQEFRFIHAVAELSSWPTNVLAPEAKKFYITILGKDRWGKGIEIYFSTNRVQKREVVVTRCARVEDSGGCHLLFISSSEHENVPKVLEALQNKSILTVSDDFDFCRRNGMFYMFFQQKTDISAVIAWEVDYEAIRKAKLETKTYLVNNAKNRRRS